MHVSYIPIKMENSYLKTALFLIFTFIFCGPFISVDNEISAANFIQDPPKNKQPFEYSIEELAKASSMVQALVPSLNKKGNDIIENLLSYAYSLKGRPYRSGSKGPRSFDCSGFTSYVFNKVVSLKLNSSSSSQYQQGKAVEKNELQPGDLVFFKGRNSGSSRIGHVGLVSEVLPEGGFKFIHASCSKGICEDSSNSRYYAKRYVGARRVIDELEVKD